MFRRRRQENTSMNWIAELVGGLLIALAWWMILLPICLLIAAPYILLRSIAEDGPYLRKIRARFDRVFDFWKDYAWMLPP